MFEGIDSLSKIGRGYWEAGYLDVNADAYPTGDEVVSAVTSWDGEPIHLRRRYFSEDQKQLLRDIVGTLMVRYPMPNRLKSTEFASFDQVDGRQIDSRDCDQFDTDDTDWSLEGESAPCA